MTVSNGVLRIADNNALGSTAGITTVGASGQGAVVQLAGVSLSELFTLGAASVGNASGINNGGALQAVSGVNSLSGVITLVANASIGADFGTTLNIDGGFSGNLGLTVNAEGTVNFRTTPLAASNPGAITKIGQGTLNILTDNSVTNAYIAAIAVNAGTLGLGGVGKLGGSGAVTAQSGAVLSLDNTLTNVANRLGGRPLTLAGGNLNLIGSANNVTTETVGVITQASGNSTFTLTTSGTGQTNFLATSSTLVTGSTWLIRGTSLGSAAGAGVATFATTTAPTFVGAAGGANSANKAIVPWALIDGSATGLGSSFATTDGGASNIWRPLNSNEYVTSVTYATTANNIVLSGLDRLIGSYTQNSLTLNSGGGLTINPMQTLTLQSGGVLMKEGNAGISGGFLTVVRFATVSLHAGRLDDEYDEPEQRVVGNCRHYEGRRGHSFARCRFGLHRHDDDQSRNAETQRRHEYHCGRRRCDRGLACRQRRRHVGFER